MGQEQSNASHEQAWNLNGNATARANAINATSATADDRLTDNVAIRETVSASNVGDLGIASLNGAATKDPRNNTEALDEGEFPVQAPDTRFKSVVVAAAPNISFSAVPRVNTPLKRKREQSGQDYHASPHHGTASRLNSTFRRDQASPPDSRRVAHLPHDARRAVSRDRYDQWTAFVDRREDFGARPPPFRRRPSDQYEQRSPYPGHSCDQDIQSSARYYSPDCYDKRSPRTQQSWSADTRGARTPSPPRSHHPVVLSHSPSQYRRSEHYSPPRRSRSPSRVQESSSTPWRPPAAKPGVKASAPHYRNLSWKRQEDVAAKVHVDPTPLGLVDFNGLRSVPTGPKTTSPQALQPPEPAIPRVTSTQASSPPESAVPTTETQKPQTTSENHWQSLSSRGRLKNWHAWRIKDTDRGRNALQACEGCIRQSLTCRFYSHRSDRRRIAVCGHCVVGQACRGGVPQETTPIEDDSDALSELSELTELSEHSELSDRSELSSLPELSELSDGLTSLEPTVSPKPAAPPSSEKEPQNNFINGTGLGNSYSRPKDTYLRLIGMAYNATPSKKLQVLGAARWVADNIPGYGLNETKWRLSMGAIISGQVGSRGLRLFDITPWVPGDDFENGRTAWYKMRDGMADTLERWDPVLKQPLPPLRPRDIVKPISPESINNVSTKAAPTRKSIRFDASLAASKGRVPVDSSDDESLAVMRRKSSRKSAPQAAVMQPSPVSLENDTAPEDLMHIDAPHAAATMPASKGTGKQQSRRQHGDEVLVRMSDLAQLVVVTAEPTIYTAKSLFDEWPEYHPDNDFDPAAKIEEIKRRPSRKEMFGKPAMYSRLGSNKSAKSLQTPGTSTTDISRASMERTSKAGRKLPEFDAFSLEHRILYCDTLEEFFALPDEPIPFIDRGQLAYRDGTRDENGDLPRVKYRYATGPQ